MSKPLLALFAATTALFIAACATSGDNPAAVDHTKPTAPVPAPSAAPGEVKPTPKPAPAAPLTDEARAAALWKKMEAYKYWPKR